MSPAWLLPLLLADVPLPDWREELIVAAWKDVDDQVTSSCKWSGTRGQSTPLSCDAARLDRAIATANSFERQVQPDARLRYLIGLAHRHAGRLDKAEAALREAAALDSNRAEVWADLGELLMARAAWAEADAALDRVATLRPTGPGAWFAWLQRAQIAGSTGNVAAFEDHLRRAMDLGLDLRILAAQPAWRTFYQQPDLRPVIERMIGLNTDPEVLESLKQQPPPR